MENEMSTIQEATKLHDPLRRLTTTPLVADLSIMGRKIRLESNSAALFSRMNALFERFAGSSTTSPDFIWRLIGEKDSYAYPAWPKMAAFCDDGLRYVNLGERSFFAVDLDADKAIAFISEKLVNDAVGFSSVFAATLFDMTASALGLVPIGAACVGLNGKALLVFGPPRSGKTTSAYLAGKLGLDFLADEASFLDLKAEGLRVWGQFWPAAFRRESVQFLPELESFTESFTYAELTFLCVASSPFPAQRVHPATPIGCVFLERQAADVPHLIPIATGDRNNRLKNCLAFQDDDRFATHYRKALRDLGKLLAYRLPYGEAPAIAATFLRSILTVHNSLEKTP